MLGTPWHSKTTHHPSNVSFMETSPLMTWWWMMTEWYWPQCPDAPSALRWVTSPRCFYHPVMRKWGMITTLNCYRPTFSHYVKTWKGLDWIQNQILIRWIWNHWKRNMRGKFLTSSSPKSKVRSQPYPYESNKKGNSGLSPYKQVHVWVLCDK